MGFSQTEKAALILALLGPELAGQLFSQLSRTEQQRLLRAMAAHGPVKETEIDAVCEEFLCRLKATEGGLNPAALLRHSKFAGVELDRVARVAEICEEIPDWILSDHLSTQLDSVVATVLGFIEPSRAAKLLKQFPASRQVLLLLNLAQERVLDAVVLDELETDLEALREKTSSGRYGHCVGGGAHVLALLQELDSETRERVLSEVELREPALGEYLTGGLLSVERLAQLLPSHLALLLAQLKDTEIGHSLRGEKGAVQQAYLACLSKRRREDVECLLAPEKKITQKQKAEASERLRQCALKLKGEGKLIFPWEESLVG